MSLFFYLCTGNSTDVVFCSLRVLWISFWAEVHYNSIYTADAAF